MTEEENYKNRGTFFKLWKIRADELRRATEAVWNHEIMEIDLGNGTIDRTNMLSRPAQLLMGLSLEALVKGLIIKNDPGLLDNGKLNSKLKSHNLSYLFGMANIFLTSTQTEFLNRLTENVVWIAKYAIPTKVTNQNPNVFVRRDDDLESFKQLYYIVNGQY